MQMKNITIGSRFYCENYGTYITVVDFDCSRIVYTCEIEELNDQGEYEITDTVLYTRDELLSARWQEVG